MGTPPEQPEPAELLLLGGMSDMRLQRTLRYAIVSILIVSKDSSRIPARADDSDIYDCQYYSLSVSARDWRPSQTCPASLLGQPQLAGFAVARAAFAKKEWT